MLSMKIAQRGNRCFEQPLEFPRFGPAQCVDPDGNGGISAACCLCLIMTTPDHPSKKSDSNKTIAVCQGNSPAFRNGSISPGINESPESCRCRFPLRGNPESSALRR